MTDKAQDRLGLADRRRLQQARLLSIRRAIPRDRDIAGLLGLEASTVRAWGRGRVLSRDEHERLVALDVAVEMLTGVLEPSSIWKWLLGTNAHVGDRRPVDLLRSGRLSVVVAAIEAHLGGGFA